MTLTSHLREEEAQWQASSLSNPSTANEMRAYSALIRIKRNELRQIKMAVTAQCFAG
ncbi:hypothetical protein ACVWY2_007985 [Bradyrhizobium sp. JR6.1]